MPCVFEIASDKGPVTSTRWTITNSGPSSVDLTYAFPFPTRRKGRALHLDGIRIGIRDADPANRVRKIEVRGCLFSHKDMLYEQEGNWANSQRVQIDLPSLNCGQYDEIKVILFLECTQRAGVKVAFVTAKHHYGNQ
jgi:hypothetical protein